MTQIPEKRNLHLHWADYDRLVTKSRHESEKAPTARRIEDWFRSMKDKTVGRVLHPRFSQLSDASSALSSRLSYWSPIVDTAYSAGLMHFSIKLTFITKNFPSLISQDCSDGELLQQIEKHLPPIISIIERYIHSTEQVYRAIRILEMHPPRADRPEHVDVYEKHYAFHSGTRDFRRHALPYAFSVYLTYKTKDHIIRK